MSIYDKENTPMHPSFKVQLMYSATPIAIVEPKIDWDAVRRAVRAQIRAKLGLDQPQ